MVKRMKKKTMPEEEIVAQEEIKDAEPMVEKDNIKPTVIPETVVNAIVEDDNPLMWWTKTGRGTHRMTINGRKTRIKPNQRFQARPSEVSESLRKIIRPIDPAVLKAEEDKVVAGPTGFSIRQHAEVTEEGTTNVILNKFDVVNAETGKPMNDEPLSARAAKRFLEGLA